MKDFEQDYKSYKGNAYGLANTLFQTAVFKPPAKSAKVGNLYFAGQVSKNRAVNPRPHTDGLTL